MKKILIDGSAPVLDFDGNKVGDNTVADFISMALGQNKTHDTLKCFDIGIEFRRNKKAEVDESDLKLVEEVVKAADMIALIKAQMTRAINAGKDAAKKSKE